MRMFVGIAALVLVGSPAWAQSSNTRCTTTFGVTNCETSTAPQIDWSIIRPPAQNAGDSFWNGYNEARRQRLINEALRTNQKQSDEKAKLPREVGRLVASGQCDAAQALALENGDFDLANSARSYCEKSVK